MKRIRIIGLALVAVFALSAVAAASASATKFEAETYPVKIKGTQTNTQLFKVESGSVECANATFTGELPKEPGASETLKVKPVYSNCKFAAFEGVKVEMNECTYLLHAGVKVTETEFNKGVVDVECPTGKTITVTTLTCVVTVGPQAGLGELTYVVKGTGKTREVEVVANVTNIKYTESSLCLKPGEHANGVYKGNVLAKGTNGLGEQEGIFLK